MKLEIIPELEEFIVPLQKEEYLQLEKNIQEEGCWEPLTVWKRENKNILIDGHNRYKICNKTGISFKINEINFQNIEEAKIWILNNQLGRRNLNPDQLSYYRGLKYESLKKEKGGYKAVLSKGQNEMLTSEKLSKEFRVSESTIKRDSKYARGIEFIGRLNPVLRKKILNGDVGIKKSSINLLGNPDNQKKIRKIVNAADLEQKVDRIRENFLKESEEKVRAGEAERLEAAREVLADKEPVFPDKGDRINRIKGMILSNLNRAIKNGDIDSLGEIRKLIDRLQDILE